MAGTRLLIVHVYIYYLLYVILNNIVVYIPVPDETNTDFSTFIVDGVEWEVRPLVTHLLDVEHVTNVDLIHTAQPAVHIRRIEVEASRENR